ncbi:putative membrane protein [Bacillus pseudomycoides]|nr:putative membrane protein [Bacillus pseudomycoides]
MEDLQTLGSFFLGLGTMFAGLGVLLAGIGVYTKFSCESN